MCAGEVGQGPHVRSECRGPRLSRSDRAGLGCGGRLLVPQPATSRPAAAPTPGSPQTKALGRRRSPERGGPGARGRGRRTGSAELARAGAAAPGSPGPGAQTPPGLARRRPPRSAPSVPTPPPPPASRGPQHGSRRPGLRRCFSGRRAASAARRGRRHGCVLQELAGQRRG